jgi:hypothetical protein
MYCTQCGTSLADGAAFCGNCGVPAQTAQAAQFTPTFKPAVAQESVSQVRPWVRYWARVFDIYFFSILGGGLIGAFAPNAALSSPLIGVVLLLIWVFVESLLLSTFGTTPGKWLFKVRLISPTGSIVRSRIPSRFHVASRSGGAVLEQEFQLLPFLLSSRPTVGWSKTPLPLGTKKVALS